MEQSRHLFKVLVQTVCVLIGLSGILSMMYGQVLKVVLPRTSYSSFTISSRESHDVTSQEIDTGKEQLFEFGRSSKLSSASHRGNGVLESGVDLKDLDLHDANGIARNDHTGLSLAARTRRLDVHENSNYKPQAPANMATVDTHNLGLERLGTKYVFHNRSRNMKTMDNFSVVNETRRDTFQVDSEVLPENLIKSVRNQLREMREEFERESVRVFNRSKLPRNLSLLGKAIFRVVPESFLPEYRSPCFHLHEDGRSGLACLPNVFLAGFPKCATTDLFQKLIRHPEVVATSKEPHWWTRSTFTRESVMHYLKHQTNLVKTMQETGNNRLITLDASASTIWDNTYAVGKFSSFHRPLRWTHADVVRAVLPDARFLLLLREPTERLYSGYMAFDSEWRGVKSPQDFHHRLVQSLQDIGRCMGTYPLRTCANVVYNLRINVGMYSVFIRDWLKRYPRDQVHILRTIDWAKDPTTELSRIFRFLRIDPLSQDALFNITSSSRQNRRNKEDISLGELLPESRQLLDTFYTPFKEDLAQLLQDKAYLWTQE